MYIKKQKYFHIIIKIFSYNKNIMPTFDNMVREARRDRTTPYDRPSRSNPVLSIAALLQPTYYQDNEQAQNIIELSYAINDDRTNIDTIIKEINTNDDIYIFLLYVTFGTRDAASEELDTDTQEIQIDKVYSKINVSNYEPYRQEYEDSPRKGEEEVVSKYYELYGER